MKSMYQQRIEETAAKQGHIGANARWIEGWMRLEHGCLDGLSRHQFDAEVAAAIECIYASSTDQNEQLARSYGL